MNRISIGGNFFLTLMVCFGLLSAIVLPPITFGGMGFYIVTFLSPLVFVIVFSMLVKHPFMHYSSLFVIFIGLVVILSAIYSWAFGYSLKNSRDIIESIKYTQFIPYLFAIPFMESRSLKLFHRSIMTASAIFLLIASTQILGFGGFFTNIYLDSDSPHLEYILRRITVTGSDPNVGGVISCFFCIYLFSIYAVRRKISYLALSILFLLVCFKTQSRTALIGLIFGLGVYYVLYFKSYFLVKVSFFVSSILIIILLIYCLDLSYIYVGFEYALRGENNSLNVRFENIGLAFDRFLESPVFGMGPAKTSFSTTIDSEYALILQRYGLLGVFVFLFYIFYLARLSYRNLESHWGIALFSFALLSVVVMAANNIFSGYQLMSLVVILNIACVLNERSKYGVKKEALV